jgi:cytochrome b6-f complex iron-sulfur subunit
VAGSKLVLRAPMTARSQHCQPEDLLSDSAAPAPSTFSCARRELLLGAGVGGVALLAACGGSSKSSSTDPGSASTAGSSSAPATSGGSSSAAAQGLIKLSDVPSDSSVSVPVPTSVSSQGALLMTQSGGKLTALDSTCTHMGCKVAPDGGKLACPCHGSEYTLTGQVTRGPAPAALHPVAVKVDSGEVVLA